MKTKDELLKYANEHYPIGTVYNNAEYSESPLSNNIVQGSFIYYSSHDNTQDWITDGNGGAVYYSDKGWSKIVQYPAGFVPPLTDLEEALNIIYKD